MEQFGIGLILLSIISIALWVYAIADIVRGSLSGNSSKIMWLIVVIIFPILGAILYLLIGRK